MSNGGGRLCSHDYQALCHPQSGFAVPSEAMIGVRHSHEFMTTSHAGRYNVANALWVESFVGPY